MLWDCGYHLSLTEHRFDFDTVLFSRVISKPNEQTVCLDLRYKAVASENPVEQRFRFIDHENWKPKFQSEEHLVLEVPTDEWRNIEIGKEVYILPYHICPTVAWYPYYQVIEKGNAIHTWPILQRY